LSGKLILVPTPLAEELPLETIALESLRRDCLSEQVGVLVEDHKVGRQRWLRWGLPREAIERFILFNEHTQADLSVSLLPELKAGKSFYLLSDGGLPAFFDPGQKLVDRCHQNNILVTATPFPNSIALAVSLSGFPHTELHFAGFLPANAEERKASLERLAPLKYPIVLMDTPYRLQILLKDIGKSNLKKRPIFLATQLNRPEEKLFRGSYVEVMSKIGELNKVEFVLMIG
jgi:16S rRNA (cytidine1402-2'-O)-methyltransferase